MIIVIKKLLQSHNTLLILVTKFRGLRFATHPVKATNNHMYLLGVQILDPETQVVKSMQDCEIGFLLHYNHN